MSISDFHKLLLFGMLGTNLVLVFIFVDRWNVDWRMSISDFQLW